MIDLLWNAPVNPQKMKQVIEALRLASGAKVVDFGCGSGEVLIRIAERFNIHGTGVDSSSDHIAEANRRAANMKLETRPVFVTSEVLNYAVEPGSLDLALCLGASHTFGLGPRAVASSIQAMASMLSPGGQLLIADGYMKQPAPDGYKPFLGDSVPDDLTHAAIVDLGKSNGLIPLGAWTSTVGEWDEFEWGYQRIIERQAAAGDSQASKRLEARRAWMDAYLKWGRDTLGYGTYLFQRDKAP